MLASRVRCSRPAVGRPRTQSVSVFVRPAAVAWIPGGIRTRTELVSLDTFSPCATQSMVQASTEEAVDVDFLDKSAVQNNDTVALNANHDPHPPSVIIQLDQIAHEAKPFPSTSWENTRKGSATFNEESSLLQPIKLQMCRLKLYLPQQTEAIPATVAVAIAVAIAVAEAVAKASDVQTEAIPATVAVAMVVDVAVAAD
eukprot:gene24288-biopygen18761